MASQPHIGVNIHTEPDTVIEAHPLFEGRRPYVEVLKVGNGTNEATLFVSSRESAEKLFDAVSELTMRWRVQDPTHFRVEAEVVCGDCGATGDPQSIEEHEASAVCRS